MQPKSIVTFERLFFISLAIGLVSYFLNYDGALAEMQSDPNVTALGVGGGFMTGIFVFSLVINLLLWYFITRKASNIAKWIFVVLTVIGFIGIPGLFIVDFSLAMLVTLIGYVLSIAMLYFLFQPDARAWFDNQDPADPDVFE
ncbi:hypothetical protein [Altererythrobacter aquiaggeris]|uniref:hypothetical protein n=1 Tax=Aestuarierythrobacter aquiaggeris TaxID=1898396 RepID=UPI003017C904